MMLGQPRPFEYDIRVRQFCKSMGGGQPSGHTQNSVIIWVYLGVTFKRTWLWIVAGLLLLFIPLSRVYLGVHFPTDLLGGYIIGLALLVLYLRLEPTVSQWLKKKHWGWQVGIAIVVPLVLALCFFTKEGVTVSSTLMGMGVGFVIERHWVCFESKGVWWKRVFRFLLGVAILFGIWLGLRLLFSDVEPAPLFRSIRYGLVGL